MVTDYSYPALLSDRAEGERRKEMVTDYSYPALLSDRSFLNNVISVKVMLILTGIWNILNINKYS